MQRQRNAVSDHLRECKRAIAGAFEARTRAELAALAALDRASLIDHLPEFLDGLARWVEGDTSAARVAFIALSEGHALQRLQYAIDLTTLTREYAVLRSVVARSLLAVSEDSEAYREHVIAVNEGLDEAIYGAVRRYMQSRDQVRDRFIGILAHDLRTPLSTIAMASLQVPMITPSLADTRAAELCGVIHRSAERMMRMIDDVVEFARGQLGGGIPISLALADLGLITHAAVDELRVAHPNRELAVSHAGDLRGYFDRDRVLQLAANLIANAITYGRGAIAVRVTEEPDRRALRMTVHNRGPVIAAERLSSLFDPLRPEQPGTRRGLGLGLYIVRQIALGHGARCEVTSTEADGTTFTVLWPRTPPEEVPQRS
jgi:signal transduction histidine kinase